MILSSGVASFLGYSGSAIRAAIIARTKRLADEQEHRQKLERDAAKKDRDLALANRFDETLKVLIADRSVADDLRERIDDLHPPPPKTRVEELEPEETRPQKRRRKGGS